MTRLLARGALRSALGTALAGTVAASLITLTAPDPAPLRTEVALAAAGNPPTPGDFTGYGFDQCEAPSQKAMDTWLSRSPFLAAGIYISGDSRACRAQRNLTPGWVSTQLRKGWKLLPITLGPQASCSTRFPRYGNDETINPAPGADNRYWPARKQGMAEATKTVRRAQDLGLVKGSVMYYDLEAFNTSNTRCRESALYFLSAWTQRIHALGYLSGVYSSAASGIKMLDDARTKRRGTFALPDQLWIADWDGRANTRTAYISDAGWANHQRVKQYRGGHNETHGGVTINIDSNYLDVGRGSVAAPVHHCGDVQVSFKDYPALRPGMDNAQVLALKCLLKERYVFTGVMNGVYGDGLAKRVRAFQAARGWRASGAWGRRAWVALLATGQSQQVKLGSGNETTRNLQRALNAVFPGRLDMSGVFDRRTDAALREYQRKTGLPVVGVANWQTWQKLRTGKR